MVYICLSGSSSPGSSRSPPPAVLMMTSPGQKVWTRPSLVARVMVSPGGAAELAQRRLQVRQAGEGDGETIPAHCHLDKPGEPSPTAVIRPPHLTVLSDFQSRLKICSSPRKTLPASVVAMREPGPAGAWARGGLVCRNRKLRLLGRAGGPGGRQRAMSALRKPGLESHQARQGSPSPGSCYPRSRDTSPSPWHKEGERTEL